MFVHNRSLLKRTVGIGMAALLLTGSAALAQDSTPIATMDTTGDLALPANIHMGSCIEIGEVAYTLSNVGIPTGADATPVASGQTMGAADAIPAFTSITELDVPLDELMSAPHAIAVLTGPEQDNQSVVCGDIGGVMYGDTVQFGLREQNGSRLSGVGLISDNQDGTANVVLYLTPLDMQSATGEMATPTS